MNLKDLKLSDITRLVEDFQYALVRTNNMFGGAATKQTSKGKKFLQYLTIFFVIITIIIALYFIYILLFRGYPRFILDLINLKFYNKINLDAFIQEKDFLLENVKYLAHPNAYMAEALYNIVFKKGSYINTKPESIPMDIEYMKSKNVVQHLEQITKKYETYNITTLMAGIQQYIEIQYSDYKENAKYLEAFKEYYLFHDLVVDTSNDKSHAKAGMKFAKFYTKYLNYALAQGRELMQKGETKEEAQWRLLNKDYGVSETKDNDQVALDDKAAEGTKEKKGAKTKTTATDSKMVLLAVQANRAKYGNHKRILHLVYLIRALANKCKKEQDGYFEKNQKHNFLVFPSNDSQVSTFSNNIIKLQLEKKLDNIHKPKSNDPASQKDYLAADSLDEFTWLMLEVMTSANPDLVPRLKTYLGCTNAASNTIYGVWSCKIGKEINLIINDIPNKNKSFFNMFMTAYMNASIDQKKQIKLKIRQGNGYLKNIHESTFEIVDKLPIFSRIYFSDLKFTDIKYDKKNPSRYETDVIKAKEVLYNDVIAMYKTLMMTKPSMITKLGINISKNQRLFYEMMIKDSKTCLNNLTKNGNDMVQYMLAATMINTYFNTYRVTLIREGMTKMYEDQYMNSEDFAKALWSPYMKEILEYRILAYFKKIFSKPYMGATFKRYTLAWQKLGFLISSIEKMIKSSFTKKPSVKEPDQPAKDS